MPALAEFIVGLVMAIGLVGVVVPGLPGLTLTWLAGLVWAFADGGGTTRIVLLLIMTALWIGGVAFGVVLPVKTSLAGTGSSKAQQRRSLLLGAIFGIVGFFIIPVLGFPIGYALGTYTANFMYFQDPTRAMQTTIATLKAFGISALVQFICGSLIVLTWFVGLALT